MPDFDGRDWLADSDSPEAQMDAEARDALESSDPITRAPELHKQGNDARKKLELIQKLFLQGVPMNQIPIHDSQAMLEMLETDDLADGMEQHQFDARSRGIDPSQTRVSKTLTRKAQFEDEMTSEPVEEPIEEPEPDPTIQDLLEKLESITDAMGDTDIDPSLAAAATIVARRLLSKLGDMTMDSAGVRPEKEPSLDEELQETEPRAQFASRLSSIADLLDVLEIPIIPGIVDSCLIKLAARKTPDLNETSNKLIEILEKGGIQSLGLAKQLGVSGSTAIDQRG